MFGFFKKKERSESENQSMEYWWKHGQEILSTSIMNDTTKLDLFFYEAQSHFLYTKNEWKEGKPIKIDTRTGEYVIRTYSHDTCARVQTYEIMNSDERFLLHFVQSELAPFGGTFAGAGVGGPLFTGRIQLTYYDIFKDGRPATVGFSGLYKDYLEYFNEEPFDENFKKTPLKYFGPRYYYKNGIIACVFFEGSTAKKTKNSEFAVNDFISLSNYSQIKPDNLTPDIHNALWEREYSSNIQSDIAEENKIEENADDTLFREAVSVVLSTGMASASGLQRRLRVGFTKAGEMVDMMEAAGIIGPVDGARPRKILVDEDGADNILANVTVSLLKQIMRNTK